MVRRTPPGYGGNATGVRFSRFPSVHFCIRHERRSNESLRIVRRDRFRIADRGMQRPPEHVANDDAAKWLQHVEVDAIQQPIRLFVIDGVIGSIVSVIPVIGCAVESIQL